MQKEIIQWLADDEGVGLSSKCMAFVIGFGVVPRGKNYPHDPSDLARCIKLLERIPEMNNHLYKMKQVSPIWENLVEHWAELEQLFNEEKGSIRCTKTYQLMKHLTKDDANVVFSASGFSIRVGR
ncbi:hypothetical protein BKG93_02405 [Rodentibacter ratti]|uniref:Uncharacterized protein n=1 Tax=Rodentibacter ratti TaxID=1906745 RepID=A0A1V3L9V7_9PAST|nr:hypothetical protein [Rodentibacter ratti]OOF86732.1 hypothetical protein BKG93_02405 [Rodentibacter ratti]